MRFSRRAGSQLWRQFRSSVPLARHKNGRARETSLELQSMLLIQLVAEGRIELPTYGL
jgi:hypothetical protein